MHLRVSALPLIFPKPLCGVVQTHRMQCIKCIRRCCVNFDMLYLCRLSFLLQKGDFVLANFSLFFSLGGINGLLSCYDPRAVLCLLVFFNLLSHFLLSSHCLRFRAELDPKRRVRAYKLPFIFMMFERCLAANHLAVWAVRWVG